MLMLLLFYSITFRQMAHQPRSTTASLIHRTASYLENGIQTHLYQMSLVLVQNCESLKYIFESLANFKSANTRFETINFDFLKSVFATLLVVQSALASFWLVYILWKKLQVKKVLVRRFNWRHRRRPRKRNTLSTRVRESIGKSQIAILDSSKVARVRFQVGYPIGITSNEYEYRVPNRVLFCREIAVNSGYSSRQRPDLLSRVDSDRKLAEIG